MRADPATRDVGPRCWLARRRDGADGRRRADDRRRASPATCATSRCPPRSCACWPASAGSRLVRAAARALRARSRRPRWPPCSRCGRVPFVRRRPRLSCDDNADADRARRPTSTARCRPRSPRPAARERSSRRCGTVYTGAFQTQAVAWYLHLHESEVGDLPYAARHDDRARTTRPIVARPALPAAHRDPQVGRRQRLRRLSIGSILRPMATYVSRPGVEPAAPRAGTARVVVPARPRRCSSASRCCCATRELERRLLDRRGAVGRDRRPAADRHPGRRCARTARRRSTTCCCTSGSRHRGSGEPATHALSLLFALLAVPARVLGAPGSVSAAAPAWFAAVLTALQPVPLAVRAGDADVLARRAAEPPRDVAASCAPTRVDERPRAALAGAFGARAGGRALHAQLGALLRRAMALAGWRCCSCAPAAERRARLRRRRARLRRRRRCCTCRGCRRCSSRPPHTGAPWSRAPDYEQTHDGGHAPAARPHARGSCWWSPPAAGVVALRPGRPRAAADARRAAPCSPSA